MGSGPSDSLLHAMLRLGAAMCFIGHGAFGIITKAAWVPYFALFGINAEWAYRLMPLVGTVDIAVGVLVLLAPTRAALLYMAFWAIMTASLRPLAGEGIWELLERAGNYGVPLAFLLATRSAGGGWLRQIRIAAPDPSERRGVFRLLQCTTALLLIGHGGLGAFEQKPLLADHWSVLGLPSSAVPIVGMLEIAAGLLVLVYPRRGLLISAFVWKVGTELLFPLSGAAVWEFVERGGSYIAPLGAAMLLSSAPGVRGSRRIFALGGARLAASVIALSALATAPAGAQVPPSDLLHQLRGGGYVLACRHAITEPEWIDPAVGERDLSPAGREQARRMGAALRGLGIPVGPVLSSPRVRTRESARFTFGEVELTEDLTASGDRGATRKLFYAPAGGGRNRVLVTHQGVLRDLLPHHGRAPIEEGDCLVLRPDGGDRPRIVARIGADGWKSPGK